MIDHVFGRPSLKFRKYQVIAVTLTWLLYLLRGNRHGPPIIRRVSKILSIRLTIWQTLVTSFLGVYVARHLDKLAGLESPEPLAGLYTPAFFRATWVLTALDAGFWTAMHIRRRWVREVFSLICTGYYLLCAEQADEKVRKIRSVMTIDHLRVAWNKTTTPILGAVTRLGRPKFMRYQPRAIRISRPSDSSYRTPVQAWLYFDGPLSDLRQQQKVVLDIPGGGFVAMSPREHDDSLIAWAGQTGLPVLSLDYGKAPEYPYPYALNECFDVYKAIAQSGGQCVGLSGDNAPRIVLVGDSAGGNLAAGVVLMILQSYLDDSRYDPAEAKIPLPEGLVLIYPSLDVNIGNWMTDEQMALIRDRDGRETNRRVLRRKTSEYSKLAPHTPMPSDDEDEPSPPSLFAKADEAVGGRRRPSSSIPTNSVTGASLTRTRIATPSLISYTSDRVLTPEMLRAMILLYIGPHSRPDFATDYLLSPVLAPESLLARWPKTYFFTGERDPLVDDTVIMAGRIRAARRAAWQERAEMDLLSRAEKRRGWHSTDAVEVHLVEGISHGFLQMAQLFPPAWRYIHRVGSWFEDIFAMSDARRRDEKRETNLHDRRHRAMAYENNKARHHHRSGTASSTDADLEDAPLEIRMNGASSLRGRRGHPTVSTAYDNKAGSEIEIDEESQIEDKGEERQRRTSSPTSEPPTPFSTSAASELARDHPLASRQKSATSLGSEDDLLGRRMRGLVGRLGGMTPGPGT